MKISEIFYSIQGEGKWMGLPNIFIRTAGCNLRCSFCDTAYAYTSGKEMKINEIVDKIQKFHCNNVCVTGGEPLFQKDTYDLVDALLKNNYKLCLETNGSISIEKISGIKSLMISLDIKCPSSKMSEKMNFDNISYLTGNDQLKFIINDREDYEYSKKTIKEHRPPCEIFFQPVWGTNTKSLSSWILKDALDVKLGLQLHKIIWGEQRGI
jgi:7-carboxy-7-deazaguanine synthase